MKTELCSKINPQRLEEAAKTVSLLLAVPLEQVCLITDKRRGKFHISLDPLVEYLCPEAKTVTKQYAIGKIEEGKFLGELDRLIKTNLTLPERQNPNFVIKLVLTAKDYAALHKIDENSLINDCDGFQYGQPFTNDEFPSEKWYENGNEIRGLLIQFTREHFSNKENDYQDLATVSPKAKKPTKA